MRLRISLLLALLASACNPTLLPGPGDGETPALRNYRDTALHLDLGYPEGWSFTEKTTWSSRGRTEDLYFEPADTDWTRRFGVKVAIPDRIDSARTLEDFRAEYLQRLASRGAAVRLDDTGWTTLGGERAFTARYAVRMDGKDYTRHQDYICLREGRDVSLAFEVAAEHAGEDIVLFRSIADRFRFDRP